MLCASEAAWTWWRLYLIPGRDTVWTVSTAAWSLSRYIRELAMGTWSLLSNTYGTSWMEHSLTWGKNQTIVHIGPDLRSAWASANPHLVLKNLLSGFTKDTVANCTEKAWTVIFATHLIENAFVRVCLSICQFMGGEHLNESCNAIY